MVELAAHGVVVGRLEPAPSPATTRPSASTARVTSDFARTTGCCTTGSEMLVANVSFGPRTGTPEEGINHTFCLYAGPSQITD